MKDLATQLQAPDQAGMFTLNCPLADLREAVRQAGFVLLEADMAAAHGRGEVLAELARATQAPDWFGHNWDALADALGDLSWLQAHGYVLLLKGEFPADEVLESILKDTIGFWQKQGKAFWVFCV